MKQKLLVTFVVAVAAILLSGAAMAGERGEWIAKDGERIKLHGQHEMMFIEEGGNAFDLGELLDGETRTFGEGAKQITVSRTGDAITIRREETDEDSIMEIQCDAERDSCRVMTFDDNPEKVMIMISKTRECVNGVGDCDSIGIDVDTVDHFGDGAHAIVRTVKCGDDGNCKHFDSRGSTEVIAIQDFIGEPGQNMIFHSGMIDSDQVRLACPEGDSTINVSTEEANDTFLCPKHSVPMTKSDNNVFIRKIHLEEKP